MRPERKNGNSKQPRSSLSKANGSKKRTTANRTWFSARLLFVTETDGHVEADPLCEESIVLVRAASKAEAGKIATRKGKEMEHGYENEHGVRIEWRLAGTLETQDLCERSIVDGVEVFSHLFFESQATLDEVRELIEKTRTGTTAVSGGKNRKAQLLPRRLRI